MKREDFLRLENQAYAWNQLLKNAKMKQISIIKSINLKNDVEVNMSYAVDKEMQIELQKT